MSVLFVILWVAALGFLIFGWVPFVRLKRYLVKQRRDSRAPAGSSDMGRIRAILRDPAHPMHQDAKRVRLAYGGFLACWLIGFAVGRVVLAHG